MENFESLKEEINYAICSIGERGVKTFTIDLNDEEILQKIFDYLLSLDEARNVEVIDLSKSDLKTFDHHWRIRSHLYPIKKEI